MPTRTSRVSRTANCALVPSVAPSNRGTGAGGRRVASATAPAATTVKQSRSSVACPGRPPLNSRVTATIGTNSPTAPTATTLVPSGVSSWPASRNSGRSMPSAVVASSSPSASAVAAPPPIKASDAPWSPGWVLQHAGVQQGTRDQGPQGVEAQQDAQRAHGPPQHLAAVAGQPAVEPVQLGI